MDSKVVRVIATLCTQVPSSVEDAGVAGEYILEIDDDINPKQLANAALDVFHSTVPVKMLDDFDFMVLDVNGNELELDDECEDYSLSDSGEVVHFRPFGWVACYLPATEGINPSRPGFTSRRAALKWIRKNIINSPCRRGQASHVKSKRAKEARKSEWVVMEEGALLSASNFGDILTGAGFRRIL